MDFFCCTFKNETRFRHQHVKNYTKLQTTKTWWVGGADSHKINKCYFHYTYTLDWANMINCISKTHTQTFVMHPSQITDADLMVRQTSDRPGFYLLIVFKIFMFKHFIAWKKSLKGGQPIILKHIWYMKFQLYNSPTLDYKSFMQIRESWAECSRWFENGMTHVPIRHFVVFYVFTLNRVTS